MTLAMDSVTKCLRKVIEVIEVMSGSGICKYPLTLFYVMAFHKGQDSLSDEQCSSNNSDKIRIFKVAGKVF